MTSWTPIIPSAKVDAKKTSQGSKTKATTNKALPKATPKAAEAKRAYPIDMLAALQEDLVGRTIQKREEAGNMNLSP